MASIRSPHSQVINNGYISHRKRFPQGRHPKQKRAFQYSPLADKRAIRLLRILPGDPDDILSCVLFEINPLYKDECPWIAVSYAWGRSTAKHRMKLNDRDFDTIESCHEALLNLRHHRRPVIVWIDAICIDQTNDIERGHQVKRMSFIYHEAQHVFVWLGHPSEDQSDACDFLARLQRLSGAGILSHGSSMNDFFRETGTTSSSPEWASLARFFKIPWFGRKWVLQETVLATSLILKCGQFNISWDGLILAVNALFDAGIAEILTTDVENFDVYAFHGLQTMVEVKNELPGPESGITVLSRPRAFKRASALKASNPRDCVYGLLGLFENSSQGNQIPIEVDYSKSIAMTFTSATMWCIENERNFDMLSIVSGRRPTSLDYDLPSWVPNLTELLSHAPYAVETKLTETSPAGGRWYNEQDVDFRFWPNNIRKNGVTLTVRGYFVDRISELTIRRTIYQDEPKSQGHHNYIMWFLDAWKLFKARSRRRDIEDFWRTLLAYHDIHEPSWFSSSRKRILDHAQIFTELFVENQDCHRMGRNELYQFLEQNSELNEDWKLPMRSMLDALHWASKDRCFAVTETGDLALVVANARRGDRICMIPGGKVPLVIAPIKEYRGTMFRFVGEAYVHGKIGWTPPMDAKMEKIQLV